MLAVIHQTPMVTYDGAVECFAVILAATSEIC